MNAKQFRKAKRKFMRTQGHKLMELRLLGASPGSISRHLSIASVPFLNRDIERYRERIK